MRLSMTCTQHSWVALLHISSFRLLLSVCFSTLEVTHCLLSRLDWCWKKPTQFELSLSDRCHFHSYWSPLPTIRHCSLFSRTRCDSFIHHSLHSFASQKREIFSRLVEWTLIWRTLPPFLPAASEALRWTGAPKGGKPLERCHFTFAALR